MPKSIASWTGGSAGSGGRTSCWGAGVTGDWDAGSLAYPFGESMGKASRRHSWDTPGSPNNPSNWEVVRAVPSFSCNSFSSAVDMVEKAEPGVASACFPSGKWLTILRNGAISAFCTKGATWSPKAMRVATVTARNTCSSSLKRTSIFWGCTFTSTASQGMLRSST